jgi:hypothetical protein
MAIASIPQNLIVQQGNSQVLVSWDLVTGATSYSVQRSTDGVTFTTIATPSNNQYLDAAVLIGTEYFYQVASVNISGTSGYTNPIPVIPAPTAKLSLGQIRLMSQQRADLVNSNFVTTPEWNTYINQSYFELYDLLTNVYENWYLAPPIQITTDGVTIQYPLPDGVLYGGAAPFYKLMGVDCGLANANNAFVTLSRFNFIDRNKFVFPNISSTFYGVFNLQYMLVGETLYFIPTPSAGQFLRVWYQPRLKQLLEDTDILDGVSGWTEYIITDAAIKAMQKEETDVTVLAAQKMALIKRIEESAINRDISQPASISDVKASYRYGRGGDPSNGSWGGY